MRALGKIAVLNAGLAALPGAALAEESYDTPSGEVRIIGGDMDIKSVAVGDQVFSLEDYHAELIDRKGNLVLVAVYTGGNGCPASFTWLDTTPGHVGMTEFFGTCSDLVEVSSDAETVTVTMPSFDSSEGDVAFIYDGTTIDRRVLGLPSSPVAQRAGGDVDAWIGESAHEYLTAPEYEPELVALFGEDDLDALRNTMVLGNQSMEVDGNWVVGYGCKPHMCNTDFAALALHRSTNNVVAAIKQDGAAPRLLGTPLDDLPARLRDLLAGN